MSSDELMPCPFCGSGALYEGCHDVDGFEQPFMFCNSCKAMFTVEGSEDWVTEESDGMDELRAHWNNRPGAHVVAEAATDDDACRFSVRPAATYFGRWEDDEDGE